MNVRKAITQADGLRANAIELGQKYAWVFELEGKIAEVLDEDIPDNVFPEDAELMIGLPYEQIYVYYLVAMIDYFNMEFDLYQNDMQMFNAMWDNMEEFIQKRKNFGMSSGRWKVM